MRLILQFIFAILALTVSFSLAAEEKQDSYSKALTQFKSAEIVQKFFNKSYGYALFPKMGKGGFGIGGGGGAGRVYKRGSYVGDTTMVHLSIGFQVGGQAYSQIVFLEDKRAFDDFTKGNFEFAATASAIAVTSSAGAQTGTTGNSANAEDKQAAKTDYHKGMLVFVRGKGGFMYEASLGGQKYSYSPLGGETEQ